MQLLLRQITYDSSGVPEYVDSEVSRDNILIGRSPRSDIQLLDVGIAASHARLTKRGGQLLLVAEKGQTFLYNGKARKQADLHPGDEIRLGAQVFVCTAAPAGFDLALEWQYVEISGDALGDAYRTSLTQLNFSPRKTSWALFVVVLLVGLMPLLSDFWQGDEPSGKLASESAPKPMDLHKLWLSGPLLPAHELATGNNCSSCHEKPFVQVKDNACQQCHSTLGSHALASDELSDQNPAKHEKWIAALDEFSCQNCHKEHNEPGSIVSRSEGLCLDCHKQMDPAVKGFSQDAHPAFALTLLRPEVIQQGGVPTVSWWREKVQPLMSKAPVPQAVSEQEENYLKYPHDTHLNPDEVKHPIRGDALQCADCHTLTADREHFEPINMETHCSSCHDLSFDPRTPQKQLPHGSPEAVYETLEAHFVKLAFSPEVLDGFERRRLPGREFEEEGCDKDYECARKQALQATGRQFSKSGCVTCHEVSELENAEGAERWQVLPVKINHDWYADTHFDHQSHLTQSDQRGDALCKTCHNADTSDKSSDILIPGIAQCTDCHDSQAQTGRVALSCVSCHDYHRYSASDGMESEAELKKAEPMQGANHGKL